MKYPFDKFVSQNTTKTFTIEPHLVRRSPEDDSPLKIFDDSFSRFVLNIVTKGEGGVKVNVPIELVEGMAKRSDAALYLQVQQECMSSADSRNDSPAFTRRFMSGNLKGKTPVEVLLEDPEGGKKKLNEQYKWLKENLSKYPKNKELLDAITEASRFDLSTLSAPIQCSLKPLTILDIGARPLTRKKREDGKCFVYEAKIIWDFTRKYPVNITIENYYAPVIVKDNGMLNVRVSEKDASVKYEYSLTGELWLEAVRCMKTSMDAFEFIYAKDAMRQAENAERENREEN